MHGTNRSGGEGGKSLLYDPGSALRLGGREKKGKDNKWDGKRKKERKKKGTRTVVRVYRYLLPL